MKTFWLILALSLTTSSASAAELASAADAPSGPALLDGVWKLDWDRSDSFEPGMKALETPWLLRRLAGIARVRVELRAEAKPSDCQDCAEKIKVVLTTPIKTQKVEAVLDGKPRPGKTLTGRATLDRYTWTSEGGLEMIREYELPSGSQARIRDIRSLGTDPDTMLSQITIWVDDTERASALRTFIRTSD